MKMSKLIYPLVCAMAVTLATTGCKHTPGKVTVLPGTNPPMVADQNNPSTFPPGGTLPQQDNVRSTVPPGGGNQPSPDMYLDMIKDPAALAAYTVHFAYDSSAVKKSEQANLQSVASALSSDANTKLLIEGNCDERGTEEYNRALGERRALALREALAKIGVDPMRVRTISYGKDKPADPGHDDAAWAKNRRGDFILLHPKTGV
jgi:peptidoglycan-associated lipoprotein